METKYTKEYFINKFQAIPEEDWGKGCVDNHCVLWHCGVRIDNQGDYIPTEESEALGELLGPKEIPDVLYRVYRINDGAVGDEELSPKQRILNALNSI